MNARQRYVLVAAAVALLAVATAAATLDSAVSPPATGGHGTAAPGLNTSAPPPEGIEGGSATQLCVPWLATTPATLALLGAFVGATALVARRYGRFDAGVFATGVGFPGVVLYLLLTSCGTSEVRPPGFERIDERMPAAFGEGAGSTLGFPLPTVFFSVLVAAAVLLALLFVYLSLAGEQGGVDADGEDADTDTDADAAETARAAGTAADRLERDEDLETVIHRAWRDMTDGLDVRRSASTTPGEFADAAVNAGLPADPVDELTELFEAVRYGDFEATPDREARALDALRRIERETAADDSDDPSGGSR